MTKEEMTIDCRKAIYNRLDNLGMKILRVPGNSETIRIISGTWKGQDWTDKTARIRCSSLKNQRFYPKGVNAYGWVAQDWRQALDYDLLICGAYSDEDVRIFVFSSKEIGSLPDVHLRWFMEIRKRLQLFQSTSDLDAAIEYVNNRKDGRLGVISSWEEGVNRKILKGSDNFDL